MAACTVTWCTLLALILGVSNSTPSSFDGFTWWRLSATSTVAASANETAEFIGAVYHNETRHFASSNGANIKNRVKSSAARANRVSVVHSNELSLRLNPKKPSLAYNKQNSLDYAKLRDLATDQLFQRLRRQTYNNSVGVAWSRDEAGKTLDSLEISLKSAVERCSTSSPSLSSLDYQLPAVVLDRFSVEVASAVHAANLLRLIRRPNVQVNRNGGNQTLFYSWLGRSILDSSNDHVISATVIILRDGAISAPQAWRSTVVGQSRVHIRDVSDVVTGADWFAVVKKRNSTSRRCEMGVANISTRGDVSDSRDVIWTPPFVNCTGGYANAVSWLVSLVVPVYSCENNYVITEGAVKLDIDLSRVSINQCSGSTDVFANTHRCLSTTHCVPSSRRGLQRGNYQCHCDTSFYFPTSMTRSTKGKYFDGKEIESKYGTQYDVSQYSCLPCAAGCARCDDANTCDDDVGASRVILLTLQVFLMAASVVSGVAIVRLRKSKVMKSSFWLLLEVVIVGVVLVQATVMLEYFNPSPVVCISIPWLREVGFIVVYGSLQLKVFRVLAEFQSRKAQRVLLRDKDLLKYLLLLIIIVIGFLVTWTVVTLDYTTSGNDELIVETRHVTGRNVLRSYCKQGWWHYVIEAGECVFLCVGIYLCYCIRSAPTFYLETKFISFAILNELIISAVYYVVRHFMGSSLHPNHLFIMSFLRCHFTATVTLLLVITTKIWFTHRPPNDRSSRRRTYSTSETAAPSGECGGEQIKLSADSGVDVGEINLADMNPEDIRLELRRLYTQLQVYKTKSMKRDNPHISKRRGGRKPTHRRFSLQAFHYKHRLQQAGEQSIGESHADLEPASRTPEESTNSADMGQTASQGFADELVTASPRTPRSGVVRKQ